MWQKKCIYYLPQLTTYKDYKMLHIQQKYETGWLDAYREIMINSEFLFDYFIFPIVIMCCKREEIVLTQMAPILLIFHFYNRNWIVSIEMTIINWQIVGTIRTFLWFTFIKWNLKTIYCIETFFFCFLLQSVCVCVKNWKQIFNQVKILM